MLSMTHLRERKTKLVEKSNKWPGALEGWHCQQRGHESLLLMSPAISCTAGFMQSPHRVSNPRTGARGHGRLEASALQGGQGESTVRRQSRMF